MFGAKKQDVELLDSSDAIYLTEVHLLSSKGRINRRTFWNRILVWSLGFGVLEAVLWLICNVQDEASPIFITFLAAAVSTHLAFVAIQSTKRFHDLDKPGWLLALNLTVIFIPICIVWLGSVRGTTGVNRYGVEPYAGDPEEDE